MSDRQLGTQIVVLVALLVVATPHVVVAQEPPLSAVLARAASYVADFERQLSGIVAEESYVQNATRVRPMIGTRFPRQEAQHRELKSDLLLVRPAGADRYIEFRDVFEVDGTRVRDRQERLTALFLAGSSSADQQMELIVKESARYNIGNIERTINMPTLPLSFLTRDMQPRFKFTRAPDSKPSVARAETSGAPPNFTVSTEMWVIAYQEVQRPTVIRTTAGRNLPSRGRFWIDPRTGRIVMSELVAANAQVRGVVDVSYQSESVVGFSVPIEMRERYDGLIDGSLIEGTAAYGKFRQFQVTVQEDIPPVKP